MQRIIRPIKLDNEGVFIELWRYFFAASHGGHGPATVSRLGVAPANAGPHSRAMLASGSLDAIQLRGMTLQVALCRYPAHTTAVAHGTRI